MRRIKYALSLALLGLTLAFGMTQVQQTAQHAIPMLAEGDPGSGNGGGGGG